MNPSRTLIFGCGYLGRRVATRLVGRGEAVFGTTRSAGRADELARLGIRPVVADVLDPASLGDLPAVDRVLYCVGFDRQAGRSIGEVYVEGLRNALDRLEGKAEAFVYASSTGVYGGDDGDWVDESSPPDPRTESGRACLDAERLIRGRIATATVLRFAGLYGPDRVMRRDSLLRGEPVVGDPAKFLNLVQIDDAASAALAALDRPEAGDLFLVADDRPVPRSEFYGLVARTLGAPEPRFQAPGPGTPEAKREGSNKRVSNRRMREVLGVALAYPDITTGVPASLTRV